MATVVSIAAALEQLQQEEEHPLQWLQPTPCVTPEPPAAQAMSCASQSTQAFLSSALSEASTSLSEQCDVTEQPLLVPQPLTPPIQSMSSSPPPPPLVYFPLEMPPSPMAWQTPSPKYAFATRAPLQQPVQFMRDSAPALLAATGSFTALGAWSESRDDGATDLESRPEIYVAQSNGPVAAALASIGSMSHEQGKCKPCAFVHRPVGCMDGPACIFCHVCEPGERKRRQKQKFQRVQQRRLRRMVASMSPACAVHVVPR